MINNANWLPDVWSAPPVILDSQAGCAYQEFILGGSYYYQCIIPPEGNAEFEFVYEIKKEFTPKVIGDEIAISPSGKGIRRHDLKGLGYWRAPRGHIADCGDTTHCGVDLISDVGQEVVAPISGKVEYPRVGSEHYYDSLYIVSNSKTHKIGVLYLDNRLAAGSPVFKGERIGNSVNLREPPYNYDNITNHVHVNLDDYSTSEVFDDPTPYININE